MKYKIDFDITIGWVIEFGSVDNIPDHNFQAPYKEFNKLKLYELQEGIFEFDISDVYIIKQGLSKLGYTEI